MKSAQLKRRILSDNERAAAALRRNFDAAGTVVLNLISSPGSGKTTLLEQTARRLSGRLQMAALVGDVATDLDARRLRDAGLPAHQIATGGSCHLDARLIAAALRECTFGQPDILLIENVGNLICPTGYDLGEDAKVALLSVTEGTDKPFKYPALFTRAAITVITKIDLRQHVSFDLDAVRSQILTLNPHAQIIQTSMFGEGMDSWCDTIRQLVEVKRGSPATR